MGKNISVVVPVFNEEESVKKLHQEIKNIARRDNLNVEIIFVDDGSTDKTYQVLKNLKPIKIIKFRKNFGQTAAFDAGIKSSQHEIVVTMDGDRQNDPLGIPLLLKKLNQGYDAVVGWRKKRHDLPIKKTVSRVAYFLRRSILGDKIHDSGCSLKAFRSYCFKDLNLMGEEHRLIPAILAWRGYKISEVVVPHRSRKKGKTKYNWKRTIKGFVDMLGVWFWRSYSARPLHLFGGLGILSFVCGFLGILILLILRLAQIIYLSDRIWPLIFLFMIIAGIQLFVTGFLADIMIKSYYRSPQNSYYSIEEITENREKK